MLVKVHNNIERFHAFINEELDDIALLNFHRFVTSLNGAKESSLALSPNVLEFCYYISK
jgi:hypothetical protein